MNAGELLEQARARYRAGEVEEASLLCVRLAELSRAAGDVATLTDAAVLIRRPLDPAVRARVHALAAEALAALGDTDPVRSARVRAQLDATRDLFQPDQPPPVVNGDDPETVFLDLQARVSAASVEDCLALAQQTIDLGRRAAHLEYEAWGRRWRMDAWATLGRFAELHDEIALARPLAERLGPDWRALHLLTRASEDLRQGRYAEGLLLADEARDVGRPGGEASYLHLVFEFGAARETGERIQEVTAAVREVVAGLPFQARSWLVVALVAAGRSEEASELWHALAPYVDRMPAHTPEFLIAAVGNVDVCVALRDTTTAAKLYEILLPYDGLHAIAHAYGPYVGPVALALGKLARLLGRTEVAKQHLTDALAAAQRAESPPKTAQARAELAQLLGPRTRAGREHAELALGLATRFGLKPLARDLDSWLSPGRRDPALTARENEIAALVAEGLTNAGIAGRLTLSERTVENHVSRILHKLLLTSRTALAVWYTDRR
ncbi:helix-turn-helix transcriptional regulator [Actinoplanes bogorensis]|uniref:Helix-turn-helix transcriptional regulator n=1 Tax=Paractinoplanes bogorensis TaxID=1610840 RepID=A0ABS5Z2M1_9ACTN|nr:helix-turn-helix transcriptional regulator [Actinoplanes bogorensis]MBU2669902.1 helix-turn-helix transcriptional regulator [Actinoplanes bogorensis]